MTFTKDNYPSDWWKHLIKGDVVESISTSGASKCYRTVGSVHIIHSKSLDRIEYTTLDKSKLSTSKTHEFKPISMKAFTPGIDNYEIY